jgi:hypothetical protein
MTPPAVCPLCGMDVDRWSEHGETLVHFRGDGGNPCVLRPPTTIDQPEPSETTA